MVALSITEAKFIACTKAVKESLWFKGFTQQLGIVSSDDIDTVYCDNQSSIHFLKHFMFHSRSKNIAIKCFHQGYSCTWFN